MLKIIVSAFSTRLVAISKKSIIQLASTNKSSTIKVTFTSGDNITKWASTINGKVDKINIDNIVN